MADRFRSSAGPSLASVSVVIPHYGSSSLTHTLVLQLFAQDYGGDLQVIVADDCSPTPYTAVADEEVVRRAKNGGFGSAVNSGVDMAIGEFLLILNSDVSVTPPFLGRLMRASAPWQPAVCAPAVRTGGSLEWTGRRFPRARYEFIERVQPLARWRNTDRWRRAVGIEARADPGRTSVVDWVAGVALLVPAKEFRDAVGFDSRFFMYCEETDLQRRLSKKRLPRVLLGEVSVEHVGAASSDDSRTRGWLIASRLAYAEKWGNLSRTRTAMQLATIASTGSQLVRLGLGRDVKPFEEARQTLRMIRELAPPQGGERSKGT